MKFLKILTENGQAVAHNCGYQLSAGKEILNRETGEIEATGLLGYARNMGVVMTAEEAQASVKTFRETFVEVPKFWKEVERTAKRAVQKKIPCAIGPVVFDVQDDFMRIRLPSDRFLYYHQPRVRMGKTSWGEERLQLSYMGLNERNQWHRTSTYGGKLTENLCQAIARDLLALGIARAHKAGLDIRLHVHDQIVALSRTERAKHDLEVLKACMTNTVPWAKDLPLAAGGFVSKVFLKD